MPVQQGLFYLRARGLEWKDLVPTGAMPRRHGVAPAWGLPREHRKPAWSLVAGAGGAPQPRLRRALPSWAPVPQLAGRVFLGQAGSSRTSMRVTRLTCTRAPSPASLARSTTETRLCLRLLQRLLGEDLDESFGDSAYAWHRAQVLMHDEVERLRRKWRLESDSNESPRSANGGARDDEAEASLGRVEAALEAAHPEREVDRASRPQPLRWSMRAIPRDEILRAPERCTSFLPSTRSSAATRRATVAVETPS